MPKILPAFLTALILQAAIGQTSATHSSVKPAVPDTISPVGHWIADHPPKDTLALWWNIRGDGTLTLSIGGIVNGTYKLDGNILTLPSNEPGQVPGVFDIHFKDGKLYMRAHAENPPAMEFTRVGPQVNSESAIVGTWRPSNAPHANDPEQEEIRNRMMNIVEVFGADGSYHVRMPVHTVEGQWDPATKTCKLKDFPALSYERKGSRLEIAAPPDGKEKQLYLPDTISLP